MKPAQPQKGPQANPVRPGLTRPLTAEERRRAQRVLVRVAVNGALIVVPESLAQGTKISIENVKAQKTIEATVVRPPQFSPDGSMIPVEFAALSPNFWNIFFPPVVN